MQSPRLQIRWKTSIDTKGIYSKTWTNIFFLFFFYEQSRFLRKRRSFRWLAASPFYPSQKLGELSTFVVLPGLYEDTPADLREECLRELNELS